MSQLAGVIEALLGAKRVTVLTGAGISAESGIPTFRGKDGFWRKYDAMKLATIEAFYDDPNLVWQWYDERLAILFLLCFGRYAFIFLFFFSFKFPYFGLNR